MIAANVMTRDPAVLREDAVVEDAVKLFKSTPFHQFPVVDGSGRAVGSISTLAILHAAVPAYADKKLLATMAGGPDIGSVYKNLRQVFDKPVTEIMERPFDSVDEQTPTSAVAAKLVNIQHDSPNLLVTDHDGKLVGIISARDIVCRAAG